MPDELKRALQDFAAFAGRLKGAEKSEAQTFARADMRTTERSFAELLYADRGLQNPLSGACHDVIVEL